MLRGKRRLLAWCVCPAVLAALPAPVPSAPGEARVQQPDVRVFTLAGGGSQAPRAGLAATEVDFEWLDVAALADGRVAIAAPGGPFVVGADGRLAALPRTTEAGRRLTVGIVASAPDGSLLGVPANATAVFRLVPGAEAWTRVTALSRIPRFHPTDLVTDVDAAPGGLVVASGEGVWFLGDDGAERRLEAEGTETLSSHQVAVAPDGTIAFTYSVRGEIAVFPPDGSRQTLVVPDQPYWLAQMGLAALPDGFLARVTGSLDIFDRAGTALSRAGGAPGLGSGDGGPPATAALHGVEVDAAGERVLVVQDAQIGIEGAPFDLVSERRGNGALANTLAPEWSPHDVIRVLTGPGAPFPLAAIRPSTYESLAEGRLGIATTFAGTARAVLLARGREIARVEAAVSPGDSELQLPAAPRPGEYRVRLTVEGADGRRAVARIAVITHDRLTRKRAVRLLRAVPPPSIFWNGVLVERCRRTGPTEFRCAQTGEKSLPPPNPRRCIATVTARLRPDGVHAFRDGGRDACLALRSARATPERPPRRAATA